MNAKRTAENDARIALYRRIWEACDSEQRNQLKAALYSLSLARKTIGEATEGRVYVPFNTLATCDFDPDEMPAELVDAHPLKPGAGATSRP